MQTPESVDSIEQLGGVTSGEVAVLEDKSLQYCLDLFFERHFACDFCSFDYRPDFEQKCRNDQFLSCAIVALCGRYLNPQDAQEYFGVASAHEISSTIYQRLDHGPR